VGFRVIDTLVASLNQLGIKAVKLDEYDPEVRFHPNPRESVSDVVLSGYIDSLFEEINHNITDTNTSQVEQAQLLRAELQDQQLVYEGQIKKLGQELEQCRQSLEHSQEKSLRTQAAHDSTLVEHKNVRRKLAKLERLEEDRKSEEKKAFEQLLLIQSKNAKVPSVSANKKLSAKAKAEPPILESPNGTPPCFANPAPAPKSRSVASDRAASNLAALAMCNSPVVQRPVEEDSERLLQQPIANKENRRTAVNSLGESRDRPFKHGLEHRKR